MTFRLGSPFRSERCFSRSRWWPSPSAALSLPPLAPLNGGGNRSKDKERLEMITDTQLLSILEKAHAHPHSWRISLDPQNIHMTVSVATAIRAMRETFETGRKDCEIEMEAAGFRQP